MTAQFVGVTEIAGQKISAEQLERTCHRYHWAARRCAGKDVLEAACGAGPGLILLDSSARSLAAGDFSPEVLASARQTAGDGIALSVFSAEELPFADASFDAVLLFEALYYLPQPERFFAEARRVLRTDGELLIVTCNKDLFDFNASPFSHRYFGVAELADALSPHGFEARFFGYTDTRELSLRQRILRPIKAIAARLGLIPRTMRSKEWLKILVFGRMTEMPASVACVPFDYAEPTPLPAGVADHRFKVIYCAATLDQPSASARAD